LRNLSSEFLIWLPAPFLSLQVLVLSFLAAWHSAPATHLASSKVKTRATEFGFNRDFRTATAAGDLRRGAKPALLAMRTWMTGR
jgi:hypothetical protein